MSSVSGTKVAAGSSKRTSAKGSTKGSDNVNEKTAFDIADDAVQVLKADGTVSTLGADEFDVYIEVILFRSIPGKSCLVTVW